MDAIPTVTDKLGLKKPLGTDKVTRAAYNENLDIIDRLVTRDQFYLDSLSYNETGSVISFVLGAGFVEIVGSEVVSASLSVDTACNIVNPVINTIYNVCIKSDGTINTDTGDIPADSLLLWEIVVGQSLSSLSKRDKRGILSNVGSRVVQHIDDASAHGLGTHREDNTAHGLGAHIADTTAHGMGEHLLNPNAHTLTNSITYYVNAATGNDDNDGSSSGSPLKTITAAINKLPPRINVTANITISAGTYDENVYVKGFSGSGTINIKRLSSDIVNINGIINIMGCHLEVVLSNLIIRKVDIDNSVDVNVEYCSINTTEPYLSNGISIENSNARIYITTISNCGDSAIDAHKGSQVFSDGNSGVNNVIGLRAYSTGCIAKRLGQPSGTTPEATVDGGQIR